jgi:hypothetical protein
LNNSEAFDYFSTDPLQWLATGKRHWICASRLRDQLAKMVGESSTIEAVRETKLALMNTLMMLTGYCFENLFKGLAAARQMDVEKMCRARGGHGISVYGSKLLELTQEERWFLERAEEFAVWAGKYAAPRDSPAFIDAEKKQKRSMRFDDVVLGNGLIARIESQILTAMAEST